MDEMISHRTASSSPIYFGRISCTNADVARIIYCHPVFWQPTIRYVSKERNVAIVIELDSTQSIGNIVICQPASVHDAEDLPFQTR